ncbi:hypothetical protein M407DRAFT_27118 [Tulasnella calospora MUT 4182]|uniref:Uncharacterized protein n=1 Tax=Tulasnella calospora MUT 4182 TaxID=1051891 RepID=A0A0C3LPU2_9AGAM|nr:hypothetical protein M407DRAFT_27118 [Tulasnella calospora MUT 4182]
MSTASSSSGTAPSPETTFYSNGMPVIWPETHGSATYIWSTILVSTFIVVAFYIWRLFKSRAQQRTAVHGNAAETRAPKSNPSDPEKPCLYDAYLAPYLEDDRSPAKGCWSEVMPLSAMIREHANSKPNYESSHTLLGNSSSPPRRATLIRTSTSSTLSTLIDSNEGRHDPVELAFLVAMPSPLRTPESEGLCEFSAGPELMLGSMEARRREA